MRTFRREYIWGPCRRGGQRPQELRRWHQCSAACKLWRRLQTVWWALYHRCCQDLVTHAFFYWLTYMPWMMYVGGKVNLPDAIEGAMLNALGGISVPSRRSFFSCASWLAYEFEVPACSRQKQGRVCISPQRSPNAPRHPYMMINKGRWN